MEEALRLLPPAWRGAGSAPAHSLSLSPDAVAALHALSAVLALSLGLLSFDGSLYGWHPLGMALGYQFFMAEGILSAISLRPVTAGSDRIRGITAHAAVALRTGACVAIGASAIVLNKVLHGKRHFGSLHAKVGLLALLMTAATPLLGALAFRSWRLLPRLLGWPADKEPPPATVLAIKRAHRCLGTASYFVSVVAIQLALGHKAARRAWLTPIWRLMSLCVAVGMAVALLLGTAAAQGGGGSNGGGGGSGARAASDGGVQEEEDRSGGAPSSSARGGHGEEGTELTGVKAV
jgi:hypothetical protein